MGVLEDFWLTYITLLLNICVSVWPSNPNAEISTLIVTFNILIPLCSLYTVFLFLSYIHESHASYIYQ